MTQFINSVSLITECLLSNDTVLPGAKFEHFGSETAVHKSLKTQKSVFLCSAFVIPRDWNSYQLRL
jgi:hypothetical protein